MSPVVITVTVLSVVAAAIGTPQVPRLWRTSTGPMRLLWMGVVFYNLTFVIAGIETIRRDLPPGLRWYLALLPTVWLLIAVLHWPLTSLLAHRNKEPPR